MEFMDIVGHRKIFYLISGILVAASIAAIAVFGLKPGIDFAGGSLIEVEFSAKRPDVGEIKTRLDPLGLGDVRVQPTGDGGVLLRLKHIDEPTHQAILQRLGQTGQPSTANFQPPISEKRFDTIGPTIGQELRRRSLAAIALVIILIVSYIAWAFRKVSLPVQSWKYGLVTVIALLHDVVIPSGFFALSGRFYGFEVDTLFVTAILTVLGFSVHDTIVVFDRIRENLKKADFSGDFSALVNKSVKETFVRSLNTSLTVVLALGAVLAFGGASTRALAVTLIVGIIAGTYSSIFIASPLLVTWHQFKKRP